MKTSQHAIGNVWDDASFREEFAEPAMVIDTVRDAERRATMVFDLLLTYLSDAQMAVTRHRPAA
jgi:hypothetical protein